MWGSYGNAARKVDLAGEEAQIQCSGIHLGCNVCRGGAAGVDRKVGQSVGHCKERIEDVDEQHGYWQVEWKA